MNPPDKAIVLSVNKRAKFRRSTARSRACPSRRPSRHHDARLQANSTTTLFAALDMQTGAVTAMPASTPRQGVHRFLKKIDRVVAKHLDLHLVVDNYKTHKTEEVQAWLDKHPRFKLHFTPTSCSWLNLVERLFAEITRQRIRRSTFASVADVEAAITDWIDARNADPKPFSWTAKAGKIITKHRRAKKALAIAFHRMQMNKSEH